MNNITCTMKDRAIELRKKGLSYSNIAKLLDVPKSTLSSWLSKLPLSQVIKEKNIEKAKIESSINITEFNKKKSVRYKKQINEEIKKNSKKILRPTKKDIFYLGMGLFLAEGSRKEKWMVRFVNSDPLIINIAMKFFREICKVNEDSIRMRIHIHPNCKYSKALGYWSTLTKISPNYFWEPQTLMSKSSKGKRSSNQLKYGTLHVTIMSADILRKLKGWTLGIERQINK